MRGRLHGDAPQACDQCGGEAFRPAARREQLARWFVDGAGAGQAWHCRACGASWSGGSGYTILHADPRWRRRARLPLDVLDAVRGARTWHPVPLFYAYVGAAAVVPAVAVAALTRVRWWVSLVGVPAAAIAGTFLWSLASAAGRGRRDVLRRLAPERAWRRDHEEKLAALRAQIDDFRLLVPEGWSGEIAVDGMTWSVPPRGPRVLHEVTIVADQGDPLLDPERHTPGWRPRTPRVEVRFASDPWPLSEGEVMHEFLERAFPPVGPDLAGLDSANRKEVERRLLAAEAKHHDDRRREEARWAGRWRDGDVTADGASLPTRRLTSDDERVGVATFEYDGRPVLVIAEGIGLDTLSFQSVTDPTSLIDELEVRRARMFNEAD